MAEPIYNDSGCTGSAPLVMGAARGRRSFYLDEHGVLRGMTYRWPWRDGENVAECLVTKVRIAGAPTVRGTIHGGFMLPPYIMGGVVFTEDPDESPVPAENQEWARCEGLEASCGCGFYAYHQGDSMYAASGPGCRVQGIVEAYGKVILGTQGYRAEKARILAISVPHQTEAARRRRELDRAIRDIDDAMQQAKAELVAPWWKQSLIAAYVAVSACALTVAIVVPGARAGALVLAGYSATVARYSWVAVHNQLKDLLKLLLEDRQRAVEARNGLPRDYSQHVALAKQRYPSVRFYDSHKAMVEDFPVESLRHLAVPDGPVPADTGE